MSKINQQKTMLELALQISTELGFSVFPCREKTQIGRAHVRTPVTEKSRMPSSA